VPVASILDLAGGVSSEASFVAVLAADEFTSAVPLAVAMEPGALLAFEMNGEVLPREHGYPARLLVPGRYGMKNAKWVVGLRPMTGQFVDWYGQRNWSKDATVKTMSRIDLPAPGTVLNPGEYNIAGIAYGAGISSVEFSVDNGQFWRVAEFVEPPTDNDAWARWIGRFRIEPGSRLTLVSRATNAAGVVQQQDFSLPEPDGSTGWPSVEVQARSV
jgi:DMSO/TMAO reductase YedYZ molybdopterin-dependent catalytic subunit